MSCGAETSLKLLETIQTKISRAGTWRYSQVRASVQAPRQTAWHIKCLGQRLAILTTAVDHMPDPLPESVVRALRNRRGLLWVCQRYDLSDGQQPHGYDLPKAEAVLRYRRHPSKFDVCLAELYWEAIWLEGAASPLLPVFREVANQGLSSRRHIVTLADSTDASATITSEFLPISVLPGLMDDVAPAGSRYGASKRRARERVAWDLASRLAHYSGRTLVVLGATSASDVELLVEALDETPVRDLTVLLVKGPEDGVETLDIASADCLSWVGNPEELVHALRKKGVPSADSVASRAIRCGHHSLEIPPRDVDRLLRHFHVIGEKDLRSPTEFSNEDLQAFLAGDLGNWSAFALGIPVKRSYETDAGRSLLAEVLDAMGRVEGPEDGARSVTIKLPAEPGAGVTTLIRHVAFDIAEKGFPAIVLRPDQMGVDLDALVAFTTALTESFQKVGDGGLPPVLIVVDVEHEAIAEVGQISSTLAAHGRRGVVLQAISSRSAGSSPSRQRRAIMLPVLSSEASEVDVRACSEAFTGLASNWGLEFSTPSFADWQRYSQAMTVVTPGGSEPNQSLFWAALRFFLVEGMQLTDAERALDSLGAWIEKRVSEVADSGMRDLVYFVAAFSSFRVAAPLWSVLRPITGGAFDSSLTSVLRQLEGIVVWGASSEDVDDQLLRFVHPGLAVELLRRRSVRTEPERFKIVEPVLRSLSNGQRSDVWLAETVASNVLMPRYEERSSHVDYDWRLSAFDSIAPLVRDQSKTVLHHWSRCLYHAASSDEPSQAVSQDSRRTCYEMSSAKLRQAIELPRRRGRNEHPSHLYNTLGTALARYARFLRSSDSVASERAWEDAADAFRSAIDLAPNVEAFLAFSQRLLARVEEMDQDPDADQEGRTGTLADALWYLDEAEDLLEAHASPEPTWHEDLAHRKAKALNLLDSERGRQYISDLKDSGHLVLATYCEARLALGGGQDHDRVDVALQVLRDAEAAGMQPDDRILLFTLSLIRRHPVERFDFELQLSLCTRLSAEFGSKERAIDAFRHAVLCYQTGLYAEGRDRFRKLRERLRGEDGGHLFARDVWRDPADPGKARLTHVRIKRWITEWRADGFVEDFGHEVPLRPRHFAPMPREHDPVTCVIRFGPNGPLAVPPRFEGL
jgi:hypothetical protein